MRELNYKYWKDGEFWVGYLELYPDYWTQGKTEEELAENLHEIYDELTGGVFPDPIKQGTLHIA